MENTEVKNTIQKCHWSQDFQDKSKLSKQKKQGFVDRNFLIYVFLKRAGSHVQCVRTDCFNGFKYLDALWRRGSILIHSSNGWGRNEVSNAFWLNPLLFSYCPWIHFSSWNTSIRGKVILQRKLSSHLVCFFYFVLTSFACQELIKRKNGSTFRIPWLPGESSIFWSSVVAFKPFVGWRNGLSDAFSVGYPAALTHPWPVAESTLIHLTYWCPLMIYDDQPKKSVNFHVKMNQWIKKATTDWSGRVARCALAGTVLCAMVPTLGTEKHRRRWNSSNRDKPLSWDFLSMRQRLSSVTSKHQLDENRNK